MLTILDTKWWPSIALILFEVFLRRVRQEARSDKQGRVWSLCFTPRKEILKYSRWHALFVVLAVHEPRFETLGSVNVFGDLLAHDVPSAVGGAGCNASAVPLRQSTLTKPSRSRRWKQNSSNSVSVIALKSTFGMCRKDTMWPGWFQSALSSGFHHGGDSFARMHFQLKCRCWP